MKQLLSFTFFLSVYATSAQTSIPQGTSVHTISEADIVVTNYKNGGSAPFTVEDNVVIGNSVVIASGAPVQTKVIVMERNNLKVEILSVRAVDGSIIKLNDCWISHMREQNRKGVKENTIPAGTRHYCSTAQSASVSSSGSKF